MSIRRLLCLLCLAVVPAGASAQANPAPSFGCPAPEHRQFDFWVGNWNVTAKGRQAGTNDVTLEEAACLVHEHWSGAGGSTGQSFNFYDRGDGHWHQLWISNQGNVLRLSGAYSEGAMRFTGVAPGAQGRPQRQRLTFFRNSDGSVRQLWETSDDEGKTWQVAFDGLYRKQRPE